MRSKRKWPPWWNWELELTPHVRKRMRDRCVRDVDLRGMLEEPRGYRPDVVEGRWVIDVRHERRPWEVIVEPDSAEHLLVVVTVYAVDR